MDKELTKILKKSKIFKIDNKSKIVIMSDCHRGTGNNYDSFTKNENIFNSALNYYFLNGYTYVELGDGDEMWKEVNYQNIIDEHLDTFKIFKKFYELNRFIMIYGNHDICKRDFEVLKRFFYFYYDKRLNKNIKLLDNLVVNESIIFDYYDKKILLFHGHQLDILNGILWRLSRLLVRYVWRFLEYTIFKELTSSAKNYYKINKRVNRLQKWCKKNNIIIITGHTHKPMYPTCKKGMYFNTGSCIHPNGITCLEIENGNISLVKWSLKLNKKSLIVPKRTILDGEKRLSSFFNK